MSISTEFDRALRLHRQGKLREAYFRYDAILKAQPSHAGALHYSGVVLYQAGKHVEAAERIRAALEVEPAQPDAWSNLALVLDSSGDREAAVEALKAALRHAPGSPALWSNLAAGEWRLGRVEDAEQAARKALAADARHPAGWYQLARALAAQRRVLEALEAAARAAALVPAQPEYASLKAQLEASIGGDGQAQATLESALARAPADASLRFQLAGVLEARGALAQAADTYEQVTRLDPQNGVALSELLFARQRQGDWHDRAELRRRFAAGVERGAALLSPFVLLSNGASRQQQRRCADRWAAGVAPAVQEPPARLLSGARLRIGYLSDDFQVHPTAFLAAGLFEAHDRERFEVVGYSTGADDGSPMRQRLMRAFDRFVDAAGWSVQALAQAIRADAVDILVDLKGHTPGAMPAVLAMRPAPIQVHYLGYPGTLGGALCDYLIGDAIVTPPTHADDYAETLALLPGSYQVNDRRRPIVEPPPREALDLPREAPVLCGFNSTWKLNPEVFDAWARILAQVPAAVLWLLVRDLEHPAVGHLRREAVRRGIDARRLVFATARPNAEYLGLYRHADLMLDTWPYNADLPASDALWAGCPLLTCRGETFAGRIGASLLHAVGLPELVTESVDDYVAAATTLARNAAERARLRDYLKGAGRASPLFDTAGSARALEAAYQAMADQYRRRVRAPIRIGPSP